VRAGGKVQVFRVRRDFAVQFGGDDAQQIPAAIVKRSTTVAGTDRRRDLQRSAIQARDQSVAQREVEALRVTDDEHGVADRDRSVRSNVLAEQAAATGA